MDLAKFWPLNTGNIIISFLFFSFFCFIPLLSCLLFFYSIPIFSILFYSFSSFPSHSSGVVSHSHCTSLLLSASSTHTVHAGVETVFIFRIFYYFLFFAQTHHIHARLRQDTIRSWDEFIPDFLRIFFFPRPGSVNSNCPGLKLVQTNHLDV